MERRDFLKSLSASAAIAAAAPTVLTPRRATARSSVDFGTCKSVKIDVLSETSWFDNEKFKADLLGYGGANTNQYSIPWDWDNAGGYSALITVTALDGQEHSILLDSGWNTGWMDYIFERNKVPEMLQSGKIPFMVLSHWHLDHLWGIESTLKHKPDLKIFAPKTFYPEDMALLREKAVHSADGKDGKKVQLCKNDTPHTGELVLTDEEGDKGDGIYRLMPGVALRMFDVPILLRVRGENVLYFNVKDKGIVTVTGCCHPGILTLFSYARRNFAESKPYGCYGGLHITLFETWDPKFDDVLKGVQAYKIDKMACNHCTGWIFAEKALAAGVPIVKGTDKYKSYPKTSSVAKASNVYLTNGDTVVF